MKPRLQVVVVSGLSGSGKSTAIRVLEDLGYFCIDNLPVVLIPRFLELCENSQESINRLALGIDVRERGFFVEHPRVFQELRDAGYGMRIIFIEAADEILVRRFSETRRPHPLAGDGGAAQGIARERRLLQELREQAERIIDTSALTVHQLRDELHRLLRDAGTAHPLTVTVVSFGYKFGIPTDSDMVLDARFLSNPFFVEELRPMTGRDSAVAEFVLSRAEAREFLTRVVGLLQFVLPLHDREGKRYFTVSVGCTGGRHRSVALVEYLGRVLDEQGHQVQVRHRDIER